MAIDFGQLIDPNFKPRSSLDWEHYRETKNNSALGWVVDALQSGALGVGSGLANASQEYLGFGGDVAQALANQAYVNSKVEDLNPSSDGYFTNPQGALYDVASAVGSSIPLGLIGGGIGAGVGAGAKAILGAQAMARLGAAASSSAIGGVASRVPLAGKLATANVFKSVPEALSEAGSTSADARKMGYDDSQIRGITNEAFTNNLALLGVSNTLESLLGLGALSGIGRAGEGASRMARAGSVAKRVGALAGAGAVQNAYEEGVQSQIGNTALGKSNANPFNPVGWDNEAQESASVGFIVGGVLGGSGGALGTAIGKRDTGKENDTTGVIPSDTTTLTPVNGAVNQDDAVLSQAPGETAIDSAITAMKGQYESTPGVSVGGITPEVVQEMVTRDPILSKADPDVVASKVTAEMRAIDPYWGLEEEMAPLLEASGFDDEVRRTNPLRMSKLLRDRTLSLIPSLAPTFANKGSSLYGAVREALRKRSVDAMGGQVGVSKPKIENKQKPLPKNEEVKSEVKNASPVEQSGVAENEAISLFEGLENEGIASQAPITAPVQVSSAPVVETSTKESPKKYRFTEKQKTALSSFLEAYKKNQDKPVSEDGTRAGLKNLKVFRGDSRIDSAVSFLKENGVKFSAPKVETSVVPKVEAKPVAKEAGPEKFSFTKEEVSAIRNLRSTYTTSGVREHSKADAAKSLQNTGLFSSEERLNVALKALSESGVKLSDKPSKDSNKVDKAPSKAEEPAKKVVPDKKKTKQESSVEVKTEKKEKASKPVKAKEASSSPKTEQGQSQDKAPAGRYGWHEGLDSFYVPTYKRHNGFFSETIESKEAPNLWEGVKFSGNAKDSKLKVKPVHPDVKITKDDSVSEAYRKNAEYKWKLFEGLALANEMGLDDETVSVDEVSRVDGSVDQTLTTADMVKTGDRLESISGIRVTAVSNVISSSDWVDNRNKFFKDVPLYARQTFNLARLMGFDTRKLKFFTDLYDRSGKSNKGIAGFSFHDTVYVGLDSVKSPLWAFGHEYGHSLNNTKSGRAVFSKLKATMAESLGKGLVPFVRTYAKSIGFKEGSSGTNPVFFSPNQTLSLDRMFEEAVCDVIADRMAEGDFLQTISAEMEGAQGFLASVYLSVTGLLNRMKSKLGGSVGQESLIDYAALGDISNKLNASADMALTEMVRNNIMENARDGNLTLRFGDYNITLGSAPLSGSEMKDFAGYFKKVEQANKNLGRVRTKYVKHRQAEVANGVDKKHSKIPKSLLQEAYRAYIQVEIAWDTLNAARELRDRASKAGEINEQGEYAGQQKFDGKQPSRYWDSKSEDGSVNTPWISEDGVVYNFVGNDPKSTFTPEGHTPKAQKERVIALKKDRDAKFKAITAAQRDGIEFKEKEWVNKYEKAWNKKYTSGDLTKTFDYKMWKKIHDFHFSDFFKNEYLKMRNKTDILQDRIVSINKKKTAVDSEYRRDNSKLNLRKKLIVDGALAKAKLEYEETVKWLQDNDKAYDARMGLFHKYYLYAKDIAEAYSLKFKDSTSVVTDSFIAFMDTLGMRSYNHLFVDAVYKVGDEYAKQGITPETALTKHFVGRGSKFKNPFNAVKRNGKVQYMYDNKTVQPEFWLFKSTIKLAINDKVSANSSAYLGKAGNIKYEDIKAFRRIIDADAVNGITTSPMDAVDELVEAQVAKWKKKSEYDGESVSEKDIEDYRDSAYRSWTSKAFEYMNNQEVLSSFNDAVESSENDKGPDGKVKKSVTAPVVNTTEMFEIAMGDITENTFKDALYVFHGDVIDNFDDPSGFSFIKDRLDKYFSVLARRGQLFHDLEGFNALPSAAQMSVANLAGFNDVSSLLDAYEAGLDTLKQHPLFWKGEKKSDNVQFSETVSENSEEAKFINTVNNPNTSPVVVKKDAKKRNKFNQAFLSLIMSKVKDVRETVKNVGDGTMSLADRYLRSPSKLAEALPKFKPFYDMAVKSWKKENIYKQRWMDEFDKHWSDLNEKQKASLEDVFIAEDSVGDYLSKEDRAGLGLDDVGDKAYSGIRGLLDQVHRQLSRTNKLTGANDIGYIKGYFPHHWDMYVVSDLTNKKTYTYKNWQLAKEAADSLLAQGIEASFGVQDGFYNGTSAVGYQPVTYTIDASKLKDIPSTFENDDKLSLAEKHRFLKQLKSRFGKTGYSTNVEHVLRKYVNSSARYMALEPFKYESRILFDNVFGEAKHSIFDQDVSKDPLADYTKGYINAVAGYPTHMEKYLDDLISKVPPIRDFIVKNTSYGTRYSVGLANMSTEVVALTTLGFWNPATGLMQLSQVANVSAQVGNKYAYRAVEKLASNKLTPLDKAVLRKSGIEFDANLGNEGYAKGGKFSYSDKIRNLATKSMVLFEKGDMFCRKVAILSGYEKAIAEGKTAKEALEYAVAVNRRANFDNSVIDSSGIFRDMSVLGQVGLQFKKYGLKQMELAYDLISGDDKAAKMRFLGTMVLLGGVMGIPFLDVFDGVLKALFGKNVDEDLRSYLVEEMNSDGDYNLTKFLLYGAGGTIGIDWSRRLAQADLATNTTENFFPIVQKFLSATKNAREKGFGGAFLASIIPTVGNTYTGMVEGQPRGLSMNYTPYERILRSSGFIPLRETIERDKQKASMNKDSHAKDGKKSKYEKPIGKVIMSTANSLGRDALTAFGAVTDLTGIDYLVFEGLGIGKKKATIVRVVDGDTVETDSGEKIRFTGVNTPETNKPKRIAGIPMVDFFGNKVYTGEEAGAEKAKAFTNKSLLGAEVILSRGWTDKDKYGRSLRYVTLKDGTNFNKKLIETGNAKVLFIGANRRGQGEFNSADKIRKANFPKLGNE